MLRQEEAVLSNNDFDRLFAFIKRLPKNKYVKEVARFLKKYEGYGPPRKLEVSDKQGFAILRCFFYTKYYLCEATAKEKYAILRILQTEDVASVADDYPVRGLSEPSQVGGI